MSTTTTRLALTKPAVTESADITVINANMDLVDAAVATLTGSETLTNKTLTTPTIASFTNATHGHTSAATGGTLTAITARAFNSANQSLNNTTETLLTFDSETFDTDTIHSTSVNTGRLTATTAGKYLVTAAVDYATNATGYRSASIFKNGSRALLVSVPAATGQTTTVAISDVVSLAANDYVELYGTQNSGGALNVTGATTSTFFAMTRLGA